MSKVLPILFNTDMVRAILDGRKTVTRRAVKYRGFLQYSYRYQTEETDYREIVESEKTSGAVNEIVKYLESDLRCYQKRLEAAEEYYQHLLE